LGLGLLRGTSEAEDDEEDVDGVGEGGRFIGREWDRLIVEDSLSGDFCLAPFVVLLGPIAFLAFISL
jgi:hypothetical protein